MKIHTQLHGVFKSTHLRIRIAAARPTHTVAAYSAHCGIVDALYGIRGAHCGIPGAHGGEQRRAAAVYAFGG